MTADKILAHLEEVFCPEDLGRALRGAEMSKAKILKNAYIAIKDGKILEVGEGDAYKRLTNAATELVDLKGFVATPGLIDAHTHLVYGGSRENEFSMKLNGMEYLEILAAGGGILSTLKATKKASFDELYAKTRGLLEHMVVHGVTAVEAKSGYGTDLETEVKELEVLDKLGKDMPVELIKTFMAAHVIPKGYENNPDTYVDEVIEMMPTIAQKKLAEFCDVFCESGVFTAEQSFRILTEAKKHGFKLRIHSDEIKNIGGVQVAHDLQAVSAEHLMVVDDEEIRLLAEANVIGNLLPGTTFSLMKDTYAPARKMLDAGMAITLCTDSNPGSCPTANLQFIMQLGCLMMRLTPIEVFNAVTINAAYSVDRAKTMGSFHTGKDANITVFDAKTLDYVLYFFATNLAKEVYIKGSLAVKDRQLV
ncbi:imidazolonepropionase [Treponema phagedenis]|uniref:Imidazolonepropionase n=1 Tax=Treponema phagedenis TaxID=162 RepID=A0A0B7H2H9_TREPH|nr:imidazolonepropionase [Treponema phagedenis]QEJ94471.1 imidazolonepropionase [Treponema phagedenis]QEJ97538.1 imidazolonepropionase [Treponema phagedenis]QEK01648.1 imidazolonepropionase [Treponema phagedenis]QEK03105.1 imidazolonepropionase [Treponema phagedenis]QEK06767.1 imidazolonepropionase [Treponema phagedenis]